MHNRFGAVKFIKPFYAKFNESGLIYFAKIFIIRLKFDPKDKLNALPHV